MNVLPLPDKPLINTGYNCFDLITFFTSAKPPKGTNVLSFTGTRFLDSVTGADGALNVFSICSTAS